MEGRLPHIYRTEKVELNMAEIESIVGGLFPDPLDELQRTRTETENDGTEFFHFPTYVVTLIPPTAYIQFSGANLDSRLTTIPAR